MKVWQFFVPAYQEPAGYIGDRCCVCGAFATTDTFDRPAHLLEHVAQGKLELYKGQGCQDEFRPVFGQTLALEPRGPRLLES